MNSTSNPAISVIVPVYKAEKYIHRCLDSIINQTFKDFELILVDDGSPDNSGEICDEYAAKDKRVKVIHKENGGVASARQCGIDAATGEYTIHADPDDWMELDMLECMYKAIKEEDADLLITDFYENNANEEVYNKQPITSLKQEDILKGILTNIHGALWNKLLKTSIYKEKQIGFIKDVNLFEDELFWIQVLIIPQLHIKYLPKAFYHYDTFSNNNSITRTDYNKFSESLKKFIFFVDKLDSKEIKIEKEDRIIEILAFLYFAGIKINTNDYRYYLRKYKEGINRLENYSKSSKMLLRLSYYNKETVYLLAIIKKHINILVENILLQFK